MKILIESRSTDLGLIEPTHEIEVLCEACGYDLDESELQKDTCLDCGQPLNLRQHIAIQVTTLPPGSGATLP